MAWKPLRVSAAAGTHLPPLLISANFTNSSYSVYLSDLTSIWSESLGRGDIVDRSREENTSIDPSSRDQFGIFCDKLKLGLDGGSSWLTVRAGPTRPDLVLNVSVELPGGLAPLEWPFRFAAGSPALITSQLTIPLLRAQHRRMQEMSSLAEILKEKDHVIQKLLDKLEGQGLELGQVFPQVANKVGRKVDRNKAAERVKGLTPFDVDVWRKGLSQNESGDPAQLINEVLGNSTDTLTLSPGDQAQEDTDEWWENIKGITVDLETGKISTKGPSKGGRKATPLSNLKPPPAIAKQESTNDDNDAFQVQATPPRSSAKLSPPKSAAESTDDDDLDTPSQRSTQQSKIPDSFPRSPPPPVKAPSSKPAKKLGNLRGKKSAPSPPPVVQNLDSTDEEDPLPAPKSKQKAPSASEKDDETGSSPRVTSKEHPSPPEPASAKSRKRFGRIEVKKEIPPPPATSETEDEPEAIERERESSSPTPKAATPPATKPKKPRFGNIGGKKKATEPLPAPEEIIAESSTTSPAPKAGVKRKLGALNHKSSPLKAVKDETSSQTADEAVPSRGRASIKPEKEDTPPPREDSEERANRRRAELQRELEEKAKAPVKKKRKF